jgi:hypothetical protein
MSSCNPLSKEHVINSAKNKVAIMQPKLNQTAEETRERLDWLKSIVQLRDDKYVLLDGLIEVGKRVSEWAKRKAHLPEYSVDPDNEIKRKGGTHVHEVLARLLNYYWSGSTSKTQLDDIYKFASTTGTTTLGFDHFNVLKEVALHVVDDIKKVQKEIDPTGKGKATLHVENFIMDFVNDIGGTIDVVAVFSDNTAAVYDFKTTGKNDVFSDISLGLPVNNPLPYTDLRAYELSQGKYAQILKERIGISGLRRNRLIPIAINYKEKADKKNQPAGNKLLPAVARLASVGSTSGIKPVPVGGETSKHKGLNILIEKQFAQQDLLKEQLRQGNKTYDQRQAIQERINTINQSIISTLVDEDISDLATTIENLVRDVEFRIAEPKELAGGKENPNYLTKEELDSYYQEMTVYSDIVNETHVYFTELKKSDPKKYAKLRAMIGKNRDNLENLTMLVKSEILNRLESNMPKEVLDKDGHILPFKALGFGELNALKLSEINHPVFQHFWQSVSKTQQNTKRKFMELSEKVYPVIEALHAYGKANIGGIDYRTKVYEMLIDKKAGNLHPKLEEGFYKKLMEDLDSGGPDAVTLAKDSFEFKDKKKWLEEFTQRRIGQEKFLKNKHGNLEDTFKADGTIAKTAATNKKNYDAALKKWDEQNNFLTSGTAWLNSKQRRIHMRLKESVIQAHASEEYKKIRNVKELNDFYEMWESYMEEFAEILGITSYSQLPPNFIPNIRKELIEHLTWGNLNAAAAGREFYDSLSVREEDIYRGDKKQKTNTIPILYMNKFFTKDGKVDNDRKSYDLGRALIIFGQMAYNYQQMSKVEADVFAMKMMLGDPTTEQGGTLATNQEGDTIKGRIQAYMTEEGRTGETFKLFEDLADAYLYGIKFKEKDPFGKFNLIHKATKLKSYNSAMKLGLAVVPASGAWLAGKTGSILSGAKGILYNNEQFMYAAKEYAIHNAKYKDFTGFFDAQNDDYVERELMKYTASWKQKYMSDRTLFWPLRRVDESIVNQIVVAMAQNWGVDEKGNVVRFTTFGKKKGLYKDMKSLYELMEKDDKGKVTIKGLSEEGYLQFRLAVKSGIGEIIGNMNPDDMGKMDVSFIHNQVFSFRGWIPAIVLEYSGKLRWDATTQAMRWGRFRAVASDYNKDISADQFTTEELETGKWIMPYITKVFLPVLRNQVIDLITLGLSPAQSFASKLGWTRINEERAQRQYLKFLAENPGMRDTVSFEHFLEIKEAQIKATMMQIRTITMFLMLAMWLGGDGEDGEPRYSHNFATRYMSKVLSKAGSELTFMWNPNEALRLMVNPFPTAGILTQLLNTLSNGFDEASDLIFGEDSNRDKTPPFYYLLQWIKGAPQAMRFLEVYEEMKKNPYSVWSGSK